MQRADDSLVLIDGPWRHQLAPLAAAGYRAVAVDLRGYGGSDKPPRGYDGYTLAADIAGLVRALGERDAAVVGHDIGGYLAWSTACLHPRTVRQLALVGSAHPRIADLRRDRDFALFQLPRYEHRLTGDDSAAIGARLRTRSGPQWTQTADFAAYEPICRRAFGIRQAAFCALEYYRWAGRSVLRPSGWRFARLLAAPLAQPVLQLHGDADPYVLPETAAGARAYADGPYEWQLLPGVGHFPHAEAHAEVTAHLIRWLAT